MKRLIALALGAACAGGCGGGFGGDDAIAICITAKACGLVASLGDCLNRVWQSHVPGAVVTDPLVVHGGCLASAGRDCGVALGCVAGANAFACSGNDVVCSGSILETCFEGTVQETDCAQLQAVCDGSAGGAACVGNLGGCQDQHCEGDFAVAVVCSGGGLGLRFDCTAVGLHCVDVDGLVSCGKGSDCVPASIDACEGTQFQYCDLGVLKSFDCRAAGFSGCDNTGGCIL